MNNQEMGEFMEFYEAYQLFTQIQSQQWQLFNQMMTSSQIDELKTQINTLKIQVTSLQEQCDELSQKNLKLLEDIENNEQKTKEILKENKNTILLNLRWYLTFNDRREVPFQLIPGSCWGQKLKTIITDYSWTKLSKHIRKLKDFTCEYCGEHHPESRGTQCHEEWYFNISTRMQELVGLKCVCCTCHNMVHIGRTMTIGKPEVFDLAKNKYMKLNNVDERTFNNDLDAAMCNHSLLSGINFSLETKENLFEKIQKLYDFEVSLRE